MDAAIAADIIISQWLHGAISPLEGRVLGHVGSKAKQVCRSSSIFICIFLYFLKLPNTRYGFFSIQPIWEMFHPVIEQHPEL